MRYRWRGDTEPESGTVWAAAQDTSTEVQQSATARLRLEISNESGTDSSQARYRLEYAEWTSSCSNLTGWGPVGEAGSSTALWTMKPSPFITEFGTTTDSGDITNENTTFVAGNTMTATNQTRGISLTNTNFTELEYSVSPGFVIPSNTGYCFRLTNAGSVTDLTYTIYANATATKVVAYGGGSGVIPADATPSATPQGGGTGQGAGGGAEPEPPPPVPPQGGGDDQGGGGGSGESGYLPGQRFFAVVDNATKLVFRLFQGFALFLIGVFFI
jgi:hypothetical protein